MGTLSYTVSLSLDGYAADVDGGLDWGAPSEEVFAFHVERMTSVSTEILGRTTYELMRYWDSEPEGENWGALENEFSRRWQSIDHYAVSSTRSPADLSISPDRLLTSLDLAELHDIVADARGEVEIFGPTTATPAIRAGLITDYRFFLVPTTLGDGLAALPRDTDLKLRLVEHRTFDNGTVFLHYRPR